MRDDKTLEGLNAEQVAAVKHDKGRATISAIAGSGKTLVVVRRIAYLIRERAVAPERILAVTFSKKAAEEMNTRLAALLGKTAVRVGTIHALAWRLLREERPEYREWRVDESGYDVRNAVRAYLIAHKQQVPRVSATNVVEYMELCRNKGLLLEEHRDAMLVLARAFFDAPARVCGEILTLYAHLEEHCEQSRIMTFGDMLLRTDLRLRNNEEARARWQSRWDYVIQDEAQDQSPVQASIMEQLVAGHDNYMMVGDVSQAIYGFRGADPKTLWTAERETRVLPLLVNYRCAKSIVANANSILAVLQGAAFRPMRSASPEEGEVRIITAINADREARVVANVVSDLRRETRAQPRDIAILTRTSLGLLSVEHELKRDGVPYVNLSEANF